MSVGVENKELWAGRDSLGRRFGYTIQDKTTRSYRRERVKRTLLVIVDRFLIG